MKPTLRIAITAVVAIVAVLLIGKCSGDTAANAARTAMYEANAAVVAKAYKAARDSVPKAIAATDGQRGKVTQAARRTQVAAASLAAALDSARSTLADAEATADQLRADLAATVTAADSMLAAHKLELVQRDSLDKLWLEERRVLLAGLAAGEARHVADAAVIRSLKAERCTVVFGIPCPTRTQAAIGGLITGAIIIAGRK